MLYLREFWELDKTLADSAFSAICHFLFQFLSENFDSRSRNLNLHFEKFELNSKFLGQESRIFVFYHGVLYINSKLPFRLRDGAKPKVNHQ